MKAIVWTNYGPPNVLEIKQVEKPTPTENQVLIKIYATTVTMGDCELRSLRLPLLFQLPMRLYVGFRKPKRITILGQELAGEIEAVGSQVTRFKKGDAVFAASLLRFGAYAEYICLPETYPIAKPTNMTYEEAATIPTGGINGLHFLRKANVTPGQKVLINGAGGSIGTYALQIAKAWGAQVTCVDSTGKLDMLRALGADHVIDYTQQDFTQNGETYDVIIDVIGKSSFSGSIKSSSQRGCYVLGNPSLVGRIRARWTNLTTDKQVISETASYKMEDYLVLKALVEQGKLKAVIDRCYPLEQTAEAHAYVDTGQKKGSVVITVQHSDDLPETDQSGAETQPASDETLDKPAG